MKIGIPVFAARVSPRFDCARAFLIVTLQDERVETSEELAASNWAPHHRVNRLVELGVDAVICGGIDCWSAESLRSAGVTLYEGVTGAIDDALAALVRGQLFAEDSRNAGKEISPRSPTGKDRSSSGQHDCCSGEW